MKLPFNNKETYLAWRAEWRANYRELSQTIRQCKIDHDRSGREYYRARAREQMEIRKQSKLQSQECFLAERAAKAALAAQPQPVA